MLSTMVEKPFCVINVLHEVMQNGVMDFVIAEDDQH
jgi:hypothetical protein